MTEQPETIAAVIEELERGGELIAARLLREQHAEIQRLRAEVLAEREACAKVCEDDGLLWGQRYAAAIRERGER